MLRRHIQLLANYNLWANKVQCTFLEGVDPAQLSTPVSSSFPSIRATLLHIWDAEVVWLQRVQGESPSAFPSEQYRGDNSQLLVAMPQHTGQLASYTQALSETQLNAEIDYMTLGGTTCRNTRAEMLQHCFNHSTYHRGQITVFVRQLGLGRPPSTDLIYYLRGTGATS
ncbi:MAG: DinB family protein [Saprospiraceae bacterium]|nr:DinB family protein [Saprospiraceae bacterium]